VDFTDLLGFWGEIWPARGGWGEKMRKKVEKCVKKSKKSEKFTNKPCKWDPYFYGPGLYFLNIAVPMTPAYKLILSLTSPCQTATMQASIGVYSGFPPKARFEL
jgi:hypothetical protein